MDVQDNRQENDIKGSITLNIEANKSSTIDLNENTERLDFTYFKAFVSDLFKIVE